MTRRTFALTAASYARVLGANDRVRMGYIGVGNRGDQVHEAFMEYGDQQTTAICDLREDYIDFAVKRSRATPARYKDYRKLLEDKNVDAVVIATPDHWHALQFVHACEAGKDVYVEKPLSLTVAEGRKMVETAARTKRVTQVGIHRRSVPNLKEAVEYVKSGALGQVTVVKGWHLQNEWPNGIGNLPDGAPEMSPEDWDRWLGPAPKMPYNKNKTFYRFRWFYPFSGGQVTNFGVHYMDMLRWCLGKDSPKSVTAMGGKFAVKDNREIPDTCEVLWDFDGVMMIFSQYNVNAAPGNLYNSEMEIRGTKATMYLSSGGWEVYPERTTETLVPDRTPLDRQYEAAWNKSKKPTMDQPLKKPGRADTMHHARNFLDCIKSRGKCNCDILTGHISTSNTLIANVALKRRAFLEWDGKTERFTNNAAANADLMYKYREPYRL